MKEEDAKKKVCIKLFAALLSKDNSLKGIAQEKSSCIGSECMMWQSKSVYETSTAEVKPEDGEWFEVDCTAYPVRWEKEIKGGDCGLKHKTYKRVGNVELSE